jgi:hypothetical protein
MTAPQMPANDHQPTEGAAPGTGPPTDPKLADQPPRPALRAREILQLRPIWVLPIVLSGVLILLIAFTYIGSVVNPAGHLNGLPVLVVNQDAGASTPKGNVNFGEQFVTGLTTNAAVAKPLHLRVVTLELSPGSVELTSA